MCYSDTDSASNESTSISMKVIQSSCPSKHTINSGYTLLETPNARPVKRVESTVNLEIVVDYSPAEVFRLPCFQSMAKGTYLSIPNTIPNAYIVLLKDSGLAVKL